MSELRGDTALDTSAIIEYVSGTRLGNVLRDYIETLHDDETVTISIFTLGEAFYILCRFKGPAFAAQKLDELMTSVFNLSNSTELALQTGKIKCERAISLVDCSCFALAKLTNAKAVFAFREGEIIREMRRKPFDLEIVFLEDLSQGSGSKK